MYGKYVWKAKQNIGNIVELTPEEIAVMQSEQEGKLISTSLGGML